MLHKSSTFSSNTRFLFTSSFDGSSVDFRLLKSIGPCCGGSGDFGGETDLLLLLESRMESSAVAVRLPALTAAAVDCANFSSKALCSASRSTSGLIPLKS